jgi:hyperosmotically inducible protein
MKVLNVVWAVGMVGVVLVAGPARGASAMQQSATSPAAKVDDSTLRSRIAASLKKNAALAAREVDVDVHEGVVTLKGVVRSADEKTRAARLATIKGVTEVRNELVVDAAAAKRKAGKAIEATERAGEKAAGATREAAQKTGEKTKEIASATGEAITDGWITTKVKTKFFDETMLKGSDIDVVTSDRVVTLTGTVASSAAKARAAAIASGTEGVTRVVNRLGVKGK